MESTMSGAPIMEESEEVELTDDDAWEIMKDFIVNDHVPPASDMPAAITPSQGAAVRSGGDTGRPAYTPGPNI